jgi:hypothetical protein
VFDDMFIFIVSLWVICLAGFGVYKLWDGDTIKSPHPITPRIEIHIKPDGIRDTTYIYKEVGND